VAEGRFRQDLFYRINVINIELPPLRERISDIPLLAGHFLQRICEETGKTKQLGDDTLTALQRYNWPGNVRELQNVVERAVLLGKNSTIALEDLPTAIAAGHLTPIGQVGDGDHGLKDALAAPERAIILEMLQSNNWNRNQTADALGINRTTLYKKMKKLGLDQPRYSGAR